MRIGELSRRVGVSPGALRMWERRYGLLPRRRTQGDIGLRLLPADPLAAAGAVLEPDDLILG